MTRFATAVMLVLGMTASAGRWVDSERAHRRAEKPT
jgi:hypothetical protein